jgi:predicted ABC-class ATPase
VEAIEAGADTLLIDEDTCATNFMIRDAAMMKLVACDREPITPFVRVVSSLRDQYDISTVLVVGGTGDFFAVADKVLVMDAYQCHDATDRARAIVAEQQKDGHSSLAPVASFVALHNDRILVPRAWEPGGKIKVLARNVVAFGDTEIDLSSLEQLTSAAQANAIAFALEWLSHHAESGTNLMSALRALERAIDDNGLTVLAPGQFNGSFVRPRLLEITGAINRLRRDAITKQ